MKLARSFHSSLRRLIPSKPTLPPKEAIVSKFSFPKSSHTIQQINESLSSGLIGERVTLSGWINQKPKKIGKGLVFVEFRDFEGQLTQLVSKDLELVESVKSLGVEDCVVVTGEVTLKRESKKESGSADSKKDLKRWDLRIEDLQVLNKSDVLSSQLNHLKTNSFKEFPPEYRYLQLRHPYYQNAIKTRSKVSQIVRSFLHSKDFTEIETPLLFKSTPEGAREFIVPTRQKDHFYALPQSPQQYKQLLMASGFKNYFQIAKCFRDEDLRKDRQPEFTQIDLEMSFADKVEVQDTVESMIKKIWAGIDKESIKTLDVEKGGVEQGDFVHLDYDYVLSKYGIDKPDLRSTLTIQDMSEFATAKENPEFPVFEVLVLKKPSSFPKILKDPKEYKHRKPIIFQIETESDLQQWIEKFSRMVNFNESFDIKSINKVLNLEIGDIIAGSTRSKLSYENPTPLGRFRQLCIQAYPGKYQHKDTPYVAAWIENFPLFNPIETTISAEQTKEKPQYPTYDYTKFESTHHPFTMVSTDTYENLATDPLSTRGDHYDLVVNGLEIGGGSRRIHDPELQRYIFTEVLKIPDPESLFKHLLDAFKQGTPPHAGFAVGFDRLCAILVGSESIRDVIAFPKTMMGSDMVVGSPSSVSDEVLKDYYVKRIGDGGL